jgi:hypothetical protein
VISYTVWVIGGGLFVLFVGDLVWLSVAMQVLNALLLPLVVAFLIILAATVLPIEARLRGAHLKITVAVVTIVCLAGVVGALSGLL